jgi:hypothetical protein
LRVTGRLAHFLVKRLGARHGLGRDTLALRKLPLPLRALSLNRLCIALGRALDLGQLGR